MNSERPVYPTAASPLQERDGISVRVERVEFSPELDAPPDRPFAFAYALTIHNGSPAAVTLKGRKWVIKECATGRCHVIEGDGLAGRFPRLEPGTSHRFENYHVVAADSVAEGSFLACDDENRCLLVRVPKFTLNIKS